MTASREPSSSYTPRARRTSAGMSASPLADITTPHHRSRRPNIAHATSGPGGARADHAHQSSARHQRPSPRRKGRSASGANANSHPPPAPPTAPDGVPRPSSARRWRRSSGPTANGYALPAVPKEPESVPPFPFDLSERPQDSFVSDTSRVTSKLFDALVNNRVGVCDAHLHTKENLCVPVSRSVLTALNSYLVDYACPNTNTATTCSAVHVNPVPISSWQLQHILEFIYTNDCSFIRNVRSSVLWRKDSDVSHTAVVDVIQLAHASHICHTPDLSTWCEKTALAMVRHRPNFLCSALNTIMNFPTTNADRLIDLWLSRVFEHPANFLGVMQKENSPLEAHAAKEELRASLLELDANTFATVLKSCHGNDEYFFRAVYCWATRGYTEFSKAGPRWRNAVKLARRIDFTKVSSKFLLGFVDSSGLVDQEDMAAIYRSHLAAKSNLPPSYGLQRTNEKTLKRKGDTRGHETDAAQKKQRVDSGQVVEPNELARHASPGSPAAQAYRRKHRHHVSQQDEMPDGDGIGTEVIPPRPSSPGHQNQTNVTAGETHHTSDNCGPVSSLQNSSLVHDEREDDHRAMHISEEEVTYSEHPPHSECSQAVQQSGVVLSQERAPPVPVPPPAISPAPCVPEVNGEGFQTEPTPTCSLQGRGSVLTEVKEEETEHVVKEEFEFVEV